MRFSRIPNIVSHSVYFDRIRRYHKDYWLTMDKQHRTLLQRNRTNIIKGIANPLDVNELLYEKNIFTENMKQEVEVAKTDYEKVRCIIDTLPKRGPNAFNAFMNVLVETENSHVADTLVPGFVGNQPPSHPPVQEGAHGFVIPVPGDDLPKDWPNEKAMSEAIEVTPCNVHSQLVKHYWNSENAYPMRKRERGHCVIISNKTFTGPCEKDQNGVDRVVLRTRYGTERDEEDSKKLFQKLNFSVTLHTEKTASQIKRILSDEAAHKDQAAAECFICIICSHGTHTGVYGCDGQTVSLTEITEQFDGRNCPNLVGKPKLFFIQACQGETIDRPEAAEDDVDAVGQDLSRLHLSDTSDAMKENPSPMPHYPRARGQMLPTKTDMLVACATHPGYVSLRNEKYGSWFLQAVIYVFRKFAHEEDIDGLLKLVNRLVARGRTSLQAGDEGGIMQASHSASSLRRKFFFFPGIVVNQSS